MALTKLFEMQRNLDEHVEKVHPREPREDRLEKKVLALLVESGECANEQRSWKFWSKDQEPRTEVLIECEECGGSGRSYVGYCGNCHGGYIGVTNPLLEEFVDKLHFILSIGLEIDFDYDEYFSVIEPDSIATENITRQFIKFNQVVTDFYDDPTEYTYIRILEHFNGFGKMLGFTWEEIEQAYIEKNKVNHKRQEEGY